MSAESRATSATSRGFLLVLATTIPAMVDYLQLAHLFAEIPLGSNLRTRDMSAPALRWCCLAPLLFALYLSIELSRQWVRLERELQDEPNGVVVARLMMLPKRRAAIGHTLAMLASQLMVWGIVSLIISEYAYFDFQRISFHIGLGSVLGLAAITLSTPNIPRAMAGSIQWHVLLCLLPFGASFRIGARIPIEETLFSFALTFGWCVALISARSIKRRVTRM